MSCPDLLMESLKKKHGVTKFQKMAGSKRLLFLLNKRYNTPQYKILEEEKRRDIILLNIVLAL